MRIRVKDALRNKDHMPMWVVRILHAMDPRYMVEQKNMPNGNEILREYDLCLQPFSAWMHPVNGPVVGGFVAPYTLKGVTRVVESFFSEEDAAGNPLCWDWDTMDALPPHDEDERIDITD